VTLSDLNITGEVTTFLSQSFTEMIQMKSDKLSFLFSICQELLSQQRIRCYMVFTD